MIATSFAILRQGTGYIAGEGDGIVTAKGAPASRFIYLFDANTLEVVRSITSLNTGRYMFIGLDVDREYLVMVRDYKKELEPFAWDYVKPANSLTVKEQLALWKSWQN